MDREFVGAEESCLVVNGMRGVSAMLSAGSFASAPLGAIGLLAGAGTVSATAFTVRMFGEAFDWARLLST